MTRHIARRATILCARHRVAVVDGLDRLPASLILADVDEAVRVLEKIQRQLAQ
jgi:hypothetical protein